MRPWHFWPATFAALLWMLAAAADYLLTELRVPAYLALFAPEVVGYIADLPFRIIAAWAVGVWGGLAGVLMMIGNARGSAVVLATAAAAQVFLAVWLIALAEPPLRYVAGIGGDLVMAVSAIVQVLIWLYARALHARGALP